MLTENPSVNRYYEDRSRPVAGDDLTGTSTYHLQLALTHHDLRSPADLDAFTRRIERLRRYAQARKKVCFYIHPLLGLEDFGRQEAALIAEFTAFSDFLAARYPNISGLFFVPVKLRAGVPQSSDVPASHPALQHPRDLRQQRLHRRQRAVYR